MTITTRLTMLVFVLVVFFFFVKDSPPDRDDVLPSIPQIVYINLAHRTDRKQHFEREMARLRISNFYRLEATYDPKRAILGCAKSHLRAVEWAQRERLPRVLICEDDYCFSGGFRGGRSIRLQIARALQDCGDDFDVLMLTCNTRREDHRTEPTSSPNLRRVRSAYAACAYVVHERYYDRLKQVYRLAMQKDTPIDYEWRSAQAEGVWYHCRPKLGYQSMSYSDIEKRKVRYTFGRYLI